MCLGIPGKIVEINPAEQWATVESFGVRNGVCTHLIDPQITIGDFVMVHAGYAIARMETSEAHETLGLLEEIARDFDRDEDRKELKPGVLKETELGQSET
jgi:hydrogenase expression/formation protein HypC